MNERLNNLTKLTALAGAGMYAAMLLACGLAIVLSTFIAYHIGAARGRARFKFQLIEGGMSEASKSNVVPLHPQAADDPLLPSG